ncbi:MAG: aspartate-semialdehyde dehydrogenase, partial [Chloroflexota bacterium]|nr:aspartate-semialdehyde dehydrogenase [Chloroflexota bacterium]
MGYNVAILGATGLVGREIIKVLEQRNFPMDSIRLLASERSAGKIMTVAGEKVEIREAAADSFKGIDI